MAKLTYSQGDVLSWHRHVSITCAFGQSFARSRPHGWHLGWHLGNLSVYTDDSCDSKVLQHMCEAYPQTCKFNRKARTTNPNMESSPINDIRDWHRPAVISTMKRYAADSTQPGASIKLLCFSQARQCACFHGEPELYQLQK